LSQKLRGTSA